MDSPLDHNQTSQFDVIAMRIDGEKRRVRFLLSNGSGWISLWNDDSNIVVRVGDAVKRRYIIVYIHGDANVRETSSMSSAVVIGLPRGTVIEGTILELNSTGRVRLADGQPWQGWVSLWDTNGNQVLEPI